MKTCKFCKKEKSFENFSRNSTTRDGYAYKCKPCRALEQRSLRNADPDHFNGISRRSKKRLHPDERRRRHKEWADKNKDWSLDYSMRRRYGITLEHYNRMFSEQDGCCAICKTHQSEFKRRLAVDHCHKTGSVRKLLCNACNRALGVIKDNPKIAVGMFEYLNQHEVQK